MSYKDTIAQLFEDVKVEICAGRNGEIYNELYRGIPYCAASIELPGENGPRHHCSNQVKGFSVRVNGMEVFVRHCRLHLPTLEQLAESDESQRRSA